MTTGSLINHLAGNAVPPMPIVGMGATELLWTDRHAYTIVEVSKSGREIVVQKDHVKRVDKNGMSDAQDYEYTPNPDGYKEVITLRKNGRWVTKGQDMKSGTKWWVGVRQEYYDFSF